MSPLVHAAAHCNKLQHTATRCSTLQHAATHCSTLQHTATHCNALHHAAPRCNTWRYSYYSLVAPLVTRITCIPHILVQDGVACHVTCITCITGVSQIVYMLHVCASKPSFPKSLTLLSPPTLLVLLALFTIPAFLKLPALLPLLASLTLHARLKLLICLPCPSNCWCTMGSLAI